MKINEAGLNLIKQFEGLRLAAYQCSAGVWTIGFGHTGKDVKPDTVWTKEEAENSLKSDVAWAEECVSDAVEIELNENQFSACVSLCFNIGCHAFSKSTLVALLNNGNIEAAAQQFSRWDRAGGKQLAGLARRRKAEAGLFNA